MINRKEFFDTVRAKFGPLKQDQVNGFVSILDEWEEAKLVDKRWLAYMLATAWHETAATMQPIREFGGPEYFHRQYDIEGKRPSVAKSLGNVYPGDGVKYFGRGYVQITGRRNYTFYGIENDPDRALDPETASKIMFDGMINGRFTGKKLADYFNKKVEDWRNARRIINGTDRAELIGGYGKMFYEALT